MMEEIHKLSIKSWAETDRPREKLLLKGKHTLSEAELLAIIISSGNAEESAVDLSRRILALQNNSLNELGRLSVKELMKFKGIGEAKGISIVAALEIGRRRREEEVIRKNKITSSKDAAEIFMSLLADLPHEEFWILLLNRANHIISKHNTSIGGLSGTVADARIIFKTAIENNASGILLCHNHPSGNLQPSHEDINLTQKLKEAGKILSIPILDHLIVSSQGYYSFVDNNLL